MCGIAAVFNIAHDNEPIGEHDLLRMRDRLTHRGPDDAGLWSDQHAGIAHTRLSVIDPTPMGHQPMSSPDGRYVLAYNGELYNDHDLRAELASLGVQFRTHCDTETLLHAMITWGDDAIEKLRGMFTIVFYDTKARTLTLARDPLGIKPLYHASVGRNRNRQLIVASEIPTILKYPGISRQPDPVTVSAYLSSIRTTLGTRTMFAQVSTLEPGDWITFPLEEPQHAKTQNWWRRVGRAPTQGVRQTIEDSVHRHLRTDVPMCTLLSGGLDSAIITHIAKRANPDLHTYCAGARSEGFADDFTYAAQLARHLGTHHTEIEIDQQLFAQRLPEIIANIGVPVSTPNEIAINQLARTLREDGHVVAISGEGADELFGGYAPIMQQCAAHVAALADPHDDPDGGLFHLRSNAWISGELKPAVLNAVRLAEADSDEHLRSFYQNTFQQCRSTFPDDSPLQAHLRFQRRMNLPNLLQRLDTSTMLASVEGRTPFADIEVAICAESLPMDRKYATLSGGEVDTKIALRRAFAGDLPAEIVKRPKASFPLPFQSWLSPFTDLLFSSPFAHQYFTPQSLGLVCANPTKYWHMAWPMINLTLWGHECVMNEPADSINQYA